MQKKKFLLIASSLATNYGLNKADASYPDLLRLAGERFMVEQKNSLLISEVSELISKTQDLPKNLVLHFGTSVGWPRAFIEVANMKFGLLPNPYYFDLPAHESKSQFGRSKSRAKIRFKRIIKNILLPFGLYKPFTSKAKTLSDIKDLLDQVDRQFDRILWIQHAFLLDKKTNIEAAIYMDYYKLIIETLTDAKLTKLTLAIPGPDFFKPSNYSIDQVHLSPEGHRTIASTISSWEQGATNDFSGNCLYY